MIISAYLGVSGLLDVGYQFFNGNETANGSRITAGVLDASDGWYSADATFPSGIASVRWNSSGQPTIIAREYFGSVVDNVAIAAEVWKVLTSTLTVSGSVGKLVADNVNATIASRSTYAGTDTSGTTTLLTRVPSALTITGGKVDVNDKTGFSLTSAYDPAKTAAQVGSAMTLTPAYDAAKTAAQAGSAMTLTSGERTTLAGVIWATLTSTLTTASSIGKWIFDSLPGIVPGAVGGLLKAGSNAPVTMNITGNLIGDVTGDVLGNVNGSVDHVIDPTSIAVAVRDVSNASPAAGSLGEDVKDAAAGGGSGGGADPWLTLLPGSYGAGTAGKILGDRLDVLVSSRLADADFIPPIPAADIALATRDIDNTMPPPPAGSLGDKINNAASAGDPWGTALPGSYAPNTAGDLIGRYVDATISSRLATTDYVAPPSVIEYSEAVRDVDNTAPAANSLGAMVKANADVGDPWAVALPGAYAAGSAGKIVGDNINATVSSRSTYAGTDTPGTTTLLTRVPSPITVTGGKVDVNDKTGFSLTSEYDAAKNAAQAGDAMTLTPAEHTSIAVACWNYLTSLATTVGSFGKLIVDNLNATVASRLPTSSYVVPDNAGIASIKSKTDSLPANPASVSDIPTAVQNAVATRDVSNIAPAPQSLGADVKIGATSGDPWSINLPGSYPAGTAGNILGIRLDATVGSRLPTANITLNSGNVTTGTNLDKTGYSLASGQENLIADAILRRDWQAVSGEPAYCVLQALKFLRCRWRVKSDGTLEVFEEDGVTVAWSRNVQADAAAIPIVGVS